MYRSNYAKIVETTIMNNGEQPKTAKNAWIFYDSSGEPLFGIDKMYNPHNGKLAYGLGRLNLVFAHYNNFDGGGHTGDTYYSLDKTGTYKASKICMELAI